jgi:hypothetical protein
MSNAILTKYRNVRPVSNDEAKVEAMWRLMTGMTYYDARPRWSHSPDTGNVFLLIHDDFPGYVLEYVMGTENDSVTTLYEASADVGSLSAVAQMRADLINEIGSILLALPSTVVVWDQGRERELTLKELGTAQLIDTLAHFTGTDITTL